jgi:hypothetical protein
MNDLPRLEGFAPIEATIDCGGAKHVIELRDGRLHVRDHDGEAELALAALGGNPPMCVEIVQMWDAAPDMAHITINLALSSDSPQEAGAGLRQPIQAQQTMQRVSFRISAVQTTRIVASGVVGPAAARLSAQEDPEFVRFKRHRELVLSLPRELRMMLAASCIVGLDYKHSPPVALAQVEGLVAIKAKADLQKSQQSWGPPGGLVRHPFDVDVRFLDRLDEANVEAFTHGTMTFATLSIPMRWLADVWCRGVSLVDGCFVLQVLESRSEGTALRVRAVRWERRDKALVPVVASALVVYVDDAWSLAWTGDPPE